MAEAPIDVGMRLSKSVERVSKRMGPDDQLRSWELIRAILRLHPEYGNHVGGKIVDEDGPQQTEARTIGGWLREVAAQFDPTKVNELNGRLVILGLSRIDSTLATCDYCTKLVEEIEAEYKPPIGTLLRGEQETAAAEEAEEEQEEAEQEDGDEESGGDEIALEDAAIWSTEKVDASIPVALRVADVLASRAGLEADSVLLFAGLMYFGSYVLPPSARRIWQELMHTRYPEGMELPPDHGPTVLQVLSLGGDEYPISAFPSREELDRHRPAIMYNEWLLGRGWFSQGLPEDYALESSASATMSPASQLMGSLTDAMELTGSQASDFVSPPPPGAELARVLRGAIQLASSTSTDGWLRSRHLLGAMLSARIVDPPPAVQRYLPSNGFDLGQLRQVLLEYIREEPRGEPLAIWEAVLLTPPERTKPSAGYLTDMVDGRAKDHLDIEAEVETIAYVLTSKRVNPPLSLGLFGDWGSGKSFFMAKLHNYVTAIADGYHREEKATGKPSQWCTRVLQIDFNAWHYSDANLWASLVTHIYDEMDRELTNEPSDKELKEHLQGEVKEAEGVVREAQRRAEAAGERVDSAADALQTARRQREEAEEGVQRLVRDMAAALQSDNEAARSLEKAANALGYPEAAESYEALVELEADLQSFSGRLSRLSVGLLRTPWTLMALALLILGLPIVVSLGLTFFADEISVMSQRIVEASAFVVSLSAGLRLWIGRGMGLIDTIEKSLKTARDIHRERIDSHPNVVKARKELIKAQSAEQAARENLQGAQVHLQQLETALKELKPERRLLRLIEERASTAAYSQHLGIISLIRADFDRISKLLVEMSKEKRDLKKELPPIQRIILYIDDLDRCRPDRVIEVLEAVHLLLAFPLFVVVVGVDPRWLRHSLTKHYPATLAPTGQHVSGDGSAGPSLISTPQDYLEKIFQIPFALRPVEKTGFHNMVTELLEPLEDFEPVDEDVPEEDEALQEDGGQPGPATAGEGIEPTDGDERTEIAPEDVDKPDVGERPGDIVEEQPQPPPLPPLTLREISPRQLEFSKLEKEDIDRLWPLFRTPRTVKRFVNIYRLLRTSLADEAEVKRFEDTEYQVALLLLAVMTSFPNQSSRFLYRLDAWLESDEIASVPEKEASLQWEQLLGALCDASVKQDESADEAGDETADEAGDETAKSEDVASKDGDQGSGRPPKDEDPAWEGLIECLQEVTRGNFKRTFSRETVERWSKQVARYSFSIHPDQAL